MYRPSPYSVNSAPSPQAAVSTPRVGRPPKNPNGHLQPVERERRFHPGVNVMPPSISAAASMGFIPQSSTVNVSGPAIGLLQQQSFTPRPAAPISAMQVPLPMPAAVQARKVESMKAQALYSTYAARLRMGSTGLMQPAPQTKRSRRGGQTVNYAEGDDDDLEFPDEHGGRPNREIPGATNAFTPTNNLAKRTMSKTKHIYKTDEEMELIAAKAGPEALVPIRLELEYDTYRIRDSFTWNLNEKIITPERFAEIFVHDLDLPIQFVGQVASSIKSQLDELTPLAEIEIKEEDMRVIINLDIQLQAIQLIDKFEWDLSSNLSPETFSKLLAADIGVAPEFAALIAHSIREQLLHYKRDAIEIGIQSKAIDFGYRKYEELWDWTPNLQILSQEDMERREIDRERSTRRARREQGRAGGGGRRGAVSGVNTPLSGLHTPLRRSTSPRRRMSPHPFSSLPMGRDPDAPPERMTHKLTPEEQATWFCSWCGLEGFKSPMVRRGPNRAKELCNACGLYYTKNRRLGPTRKNLFRHVVDD